MCLIDIHRLDDEYDLSRLESFRRERVKSLQVVNNKLNPQTDV